MSNQGGVVKKRVVAVRWKRNNEIEIFSNLKNFCLTYPAYSYNTMNNYLSKAKTAYDNEEVCVERKNVINVPRQLIPAAKTRKIAAVVKKGAIKDLSDEIDLEFWLSQPVAMRAKAVNILINQMLVKGTRLDKTFVNKTPTAQ